MITPENAKLDALLAMERPKNKRDCQVIVGMLNQLSNWIPNLSFKAKGLRMLTGNKKFIWTSDMEKEWLEMKEAIKTTVALSPLDPSLPIHLHTDAAKRTGMGFVLSQPRRDGRGRNIVAISSTGFSSSQMNYSPVECELLAIQWALNKLDFFVRGANLVEVFTDCSGVVGILDKHMADIKNNRLQRMIEKFSHINVQAHHVKGSAHLLADGLSRHPLPGTDGEEFPMQTPRIMERSRRTVMNEIDPSIQ